MDTPNALSYFPLIDDRYQIYREVILKDNCEPSDSILSENGLAGLVADTARGKACKGLKEVCAAEPGYQRGPRLAVQPTKSVSPTRYVVYTVKTFCLAHQMSRAQLYVLWRRGEGPKTYTIGRRRYISLAAAAEWVCRNEELAAARSTGRADR